MEKNGELSVGKTPCDYCSRLADYIVGNNAFCRDHVECAYPDADTDLGKEASDKGGNQAPKPLKSIASDLANTFTVNK